MITLKNVSLEINGQMILDDMSFTVEGGKTAVILGPSGAGKSSILKVIVGLWKPDKGSVIIDNNEITNLTEEQLLPIRKRIGIVFQGNALFDSLTVEENIAYFLHEHNSLSSKQIQNRVKECLSFVNLEGTEELFPDELSGGMKKRVAIARAIAPRPDIILYDEPTTGIDPINSRAIIDLIRKSQSEGATSVVVTHIIHDAFLVGDIFTVINEGKLVESGTINYLLASKNEFVREFISEVFEDAQLVEMLMLKKTNHDDK
jgi:phospholipid/cholesterol/gamma-HCH transport system ATP-binding protein